MAKPALKFDPPPPTTIEGRVAAIEAIIPSLATKADLEGMEKRLDRKISGLDRKISGVERKISGLENRISGVERKISGLENRISGVEVKISESGHKMDAKMAELKISIIMWFVSTAIAIVGILLAAQIGIAFLLIRALAGG